jgi:hypothetical protein
MFCATCGIWLTTTLVPSERRQDAMDVIDAFVVDRSQL